MEDLRILLETARSGSLTGASRKLNLTPAAASAMLKRLEARLGASLFVRSTRAMRLTPEGEVFLTYAQRAYELLEEAQSLLATEPDRLRGTIRLSVPSDLIRSVLMPWLDEFLSLHPHVHLNLMATDHIQDVVRDTVDLALRYGELKDSRLVARELARSRRVLCAAPQYLRNHPEPQQPQDLAKHNCLCFHVAGRPLTLWRFQRTKPDARNQNDWQEIRVSGNRSADDAHLAHLWALQGKGILYKSELDVMHDLRSGALVPLMPQWQGELYPLNLVLPSRRFLPNRVRKLADFLATKLNAFQSISQATGLANKSPTAHQK
jgi:DNA-binding transcriptional LysR family regulator